MSSSQTQSGQTTVLTLCQNPVSDWVGMYQAGNTMTSASQTVHKAGDVNIDVYQGRTMSTALMHELSHAPAIVGPNYLSISPPSP